MATLGETNWTEVTVTSNFSCGCSSNVDTNCWAIASRPTTSSPVLRLRYTASGDHCSATACASCLLNASAYEAAAWRMATSSADWSLDCCACELLAHVTPRRSKRNEVRYMCFAP